MFLAAVGKCWIASSRKCPILLCHKVDVAFEVGFGCVDFVVGNADGIGLYSSTHCPCLIGV